MARCLNVWVYRVSMVLAVCVRLGSAVQGGLISGACRKGGGGFRMVAESAPTEMRVKSAG